MQVTSFKLLVSGVSYTIKHYRLMTLIWITLQTLMEYLIARDTTYLSYMT